LISLFSRAKILGGLYLGWGIGANDSANIFGTAVATNIVRFRTAVILIAVFAFLGSVIGGSAMYDDVKFSDEMTGTAACIATVSAALAVTIVTYLSIPASASQAAIGGLMGVAIALSGYQAVEWNKLLKMLLCWVLTPVGSAIITIILYKAVNRYVIQYIKSRSALNWTYKILLLVAGSYGAYALGANNVVVTTGSYYQAGVFDYFGPWAATVAAGLGGLSISFGALTYSKKVMETVGQKITILDPYSAVITIFSHSIAMQIFTFIKVPVSSSQAIVGAVIGVGILKGTGMIRFKVLFFIFAGWILTPCAAMISAWLLIKFLT